MDEEEFERLRLMTAPTPVLGKRKRLSKAKVEEEEEEEESEELIRRNGQAMIATVTDMIQHGLSEIIPSDK